MPNFTPRIEGSGAGGWWSDTTVLLPLGHPVETNDGRVFRWCKAGVSDLVAGNVIQGPAFIVAHTAAAVPITAIGATSVTVTPGATAGAANLYAEGYMGTSITPGNGYTYQIDSHLAITASVAFVVKLKGSDGLQVAFTAATKVNLAANPYNNVIQAPVTTLTGKVAGVAPYIVTATQNGWLQTYGVAATLQKGTVAAGTPVGSGGSVAGGVVIFTASLSYVGDMMETGVDAANSMVFLRLG